jgi:hypothetical protein
MEYYGKNIKNTKKNKIPITFSQDTLILILGNGLVVRYIIIHPLLSSYYIILLFTLTLLHMLFTILRVVLFLLCYITYIILYILVIYPIFYTLYSFYGYSLLCYTYLLTIIFLYCTISYNILLFTLHTTIISHIPSILSTIFLFLYSIPYFIFIN